MKLHIWNWNHSMIHESKRVKYTWTVLVASGVKCLGTIGLEWASKKYEEFIDYLSAIIISDDKDK